MRKRLFPKRKTLFMMKAEIQLKILKVGGTVLENTAEFSALIADFASWNNPKILVHGGGSAADTMLDNIQTHSQIINGRRVTDAETLKGVTMIYAGLINKQVVADLQSANCNALGLSGADLNSITAKKRKSTEVDWGFVGDVETVNTDVLVALLSADVTPVFSAITHDKKGQLLNTNADTIAQKLAAAMSQFMQVQLIYCLDKNGVLKNVNDKDSTIPLLARSYYESHACPNQFVGGIRPKLDNGFAALDAGVDNVYLCGPSSIAEPSKKGTELCLS